MKYRILGRTGLKVSEIALGCEGFNGKDAKFAQELFKLALSNGINCMDLYSPNPEIHYYVKDAIKNRRSEFILQAHLCTIWEKEQYRATRNINEVKKSFYKMLDNLKTDYLDIGMLHYIDSIDSWQEILSGPIMEFVLEEKAKGSIKNIGISSHNPEAALVAIESGLIDVLMFSINPCYDLLPGNEDCETLWSQDSYQSTLYNMDPVRESLYEACQRLGVGITVMKAFGGGDLLNAELSPAGKALTVVECLHYALTRPGVACVMSGVRSVNELKANLYYNEATEKEKDYAKALASFPRVKWQGHCMYCGHCAPCPKGIDIASVTKFLNLVKAQKDIPETVREHYNALKHTAGECINCKVCEKRCPFEVSITKNMQEAKKVFGK